MAAKIQEAEECVRQAEKRCEFESLFDCLNSVIAASKHRSYGGSQNMMWPLPNTLRLVSL